MKDDVIGCCLPSALAHLCSIVRISERVLLESRFIVGEAPVREANGRN